MKKILQSLSLVSLAVVSSAACASSGYSMGPYLNATIGGGIIHYDSQNIDGFMIPSGNPSYVVGRLGGGALISLSPNDNPFFVGLEANWNIGKVSYEGQKGTLYGVDPTVSFGKVFNSNVALYAKAGAQVLGNNGSYSTAPLVGVGVGYQVMPHVRFTVEENNAFYRDSSVITGSVGLQYTFS
jgi:hypothetical protein